MKTVKRTYEVCSVCKGSGKIWKLPDYSTTIVKTQESCECCGGAGKICVSEEMSDDA